MNQNNIIDLLKNIFRFNFFFLKTYLQFQKIFGPKQFWVQKSFWSQKILEKKIWVKKFLIKKKQVLYCTYFLTSINK